MIYVAKFFVNRIYLQVFDFADITIIFINKKFKSNYTLKYKIFFIK